MPEDTSKKPVMIAFASDGSELIKGIEQIIPDRAEKVITQAHTVIIFTAAARIASENAFEKEGHLSLTPVFEDTAYQIFVLMK